MGSVKLPKLSLVSIGAVAIAGLGVFVPLPESYYRMVRWPWCLLWQLGFWLWGAIVIYQLRQFHRPFRPLGHGLDIWVIVTGLALVISTAITPFKAVAVMNCLLVSGYGLVLYAGRNLASARVRRWLWAGVVTIGGLTAVVSLSYWRPDPAMWQGDFYSAIRNPYPLGHHNFVGGYFALILPLALAATTTCKGWGRWLSGLATGLIALALYISGSRGAALGTLVWLVVGLIVWVFDTRGQRLRRGAAACTVFLISVGACLSNPRVRDLLAGIPLILFPDRQGLIDGPILDRGFMVRMAGNILQDHPLWGVGPGTLARVSNLYRPIETGLGLDHIQQLHSLPVQLLAELGLFGGIIYGGWIYALGRLWWRLRRRSMSSLDRGLRTGIGGSFLAYGASSLTDYQLENIAIALTLILLVLMLVSLGDDYRQAPASLPKIPRRYASIGVFALFGLAVYTWMPFDLSLALGQSGLRAFQNQRIIAGENRWLKATEIAPWDPTFSALAAENILEVAHRTVTAEHQAQLQSLALEYTKRAQSAAPYDAWFNQNLAVMLLDEDPAKASVYAARAAQLLPRNNNYTYQLLGQSYLAEGQPQAAMAAFTLQGLVHPESLTFPLWSEAPFENLHDPVIDAVLTAYDRLLATVPFESRGYRQLSESRTMLAWWFNRPTNTASPQSLGPMVEAILAAESRPERAVEWIQPLVAKPSRARQLLAAWLDPDQYLDPYLADLSADQQSLWRQLILEHRDLRAWLRSTVQVPDQMFRGALAFAYRNQTANQIRLMLRPRGLRAYTVVSKLELFPEWPREFPALDHLIETMRAQQLQLPHPTRNNFALSVTSAALAE